MKTIAEQYNDSGYKESDYNELVRLGIAEVIYEEANTQYYFPDGSSVSYFY